MTHRGARQTLQRHPNRFGRVGRSCWFWLLGISSLPLPAQDLLQEIRFSGASPTREAGLRQRLGEFLHRPVTQENLDALTGVIVEDYRQHDVPVVDVSAVVENGIVTAVITEGRVGNITIVGGPACVHRSVTRDWRRLAGKPLRLSHLTDALNWLHRNPMHAATLRLKPGDETAVADLTLDLQNSRRTRFSSGYLNDGIAPLSEHRFFAGVEGSDWFGLPWWFTGQFFMDADVSSYHSAQVAQRFFLPWHHELRLYGAWTRAVVDGEIAAPLDSSTAESWQASARYLVPLPAWKRWKTDAGIGIDLRRTNNNVEFGGTSLGGDADIIQFAGEISSERHTEKSDSGWRFEGIYSPGNLTTNQTDAVHNDFRPGAQADYLLGRAALWHRQWLGEWSVTGRVSGQVASAPVLPSEQIGLGGSYAIRGFPEATFLGDTGCWGSLEIQAPQWEWHKLQMQPVVFAEGGWVHDAARHEDASPAGAGCGIRLQWGRHVSCNADYAWRLTEPGGRFHVAIRMEF